MSTIPQLAALKQRKHERAVQQARYGINADPSITTELRDMETVIGMMDRIDIHRRNLAHLLQQRGHFGPTYRRTLSIRLRLSAKKSRNSAPRAPGMTSR